ncbi:MAG: hypothetical protein U5M23_06720 [Marinagarivorans sp.]|nr:hypothetical protein [Marinagarivorans sp.]
MVIDPITGAGSPTASGTADTSTIVMLGGDQPGVLTVTGAAAFADVAISTPTVVPGGTGFSLVHSEALTQLWHASIF